MSMKWWALALTAFALTVGSTASSALAISVAPPDLTFTATPTLVGVGQSATLSWSSTNSLTCTASGGWTDAKSRRGTRIVTPTSTTTYVLTCEGRGGSISVPVTVSVGFSVPVGDFATTSITAYPGFKNVCDAIVTGNQNVAPPARAYPLWEHFSTRCTQTSRQRPILFSLTQERDGSHNGAANNIPNAGAYMGDFTYATDFGKWLNYNFNLSTTTPFLGMSFDTVNFRGTTATGWGLTEGNIFYGFNDMSLVQTTIDKDIILEFDLRVRGNEVGAPFFTGYSGHIISVGGLVKWTEGSNRANVDHYFSVTLEQSPNYFASLHRVDQSRCHDTTYNTCWYDESGVWSEGRDIAYNRYVVPAVSFPQDSWTHVRIPISEMVRSLGWVSPPASWSQAQLNAITWGMESTGATRYWIEVKNYQVYTQVAKPTPPPVVPPPATSTPPVPPPVPPPVSPPQPPQPPPPPVTPTATTTPDTTPPEPDTRTRNTAGAVQGVFAESRSYTALQLWFDELRALVRDAYLTMRGN